MNVFPLLTTARRAQGLVKSEPHHEKPEQDPSYAISGQRKSRLNSEFLQVDDAKDKSDLKPGVRTGSRRTDFRRFSLAPVALKVAPDPGRNTEPRDERAGILEPERCQHNFADWRSSLADLLQSPQKCVRRTHLVVPVGTDEQPVPDLRICDQTLNEVEGCSIQPLQIIKKESERVLRLGEHTEEAPEHQLEPMLRISRREFCDRRLFADDELHLRDKADDQLAVWPDRLRQGTPPLFHFRFALDDDLTDQSLEGLCQGRIRDVALRLLGLACGEKSAGRDKHLVQLVYH